MSQFSNFKDYIFKNLFPSYFQENDTYIDAEGKGILQRFIEVCAEYFDNDLMPDIDNMMDILDVDKTSNIFLNYLWQYFDYIPYAYGVIVNNEQYNPENIDRWLNNASGFPKADTRAILKYAVSLFKIRGTYDFYKILGRFYGVDIEISEVIKGVNTTLQEAEEPSAYAPATPRASEVLIDPEDIPQSLVVAVYSNASSWYDERKAGYNVRDCLACVYFKVEINIPQGMWEQIDKQSQSDPDRWNDVLEAFNRLITKYLPVYAKLYDEDGNENVILKSHTPTLQIYPPPSSGYFRESEASLDLLPIKS